MKAKDTVMSWERIRMVFQEQDKKGVTDNMFTMEALCLDQAEISLKAGAVNERERIFSIIEEYGLDKCSARDDVMARQAKGWQALGEK